MATYTSYLNLEKPTTSETFNLLKMNQNWDKIDQGVSALNSKIATTPVTTDGKVEYWKSGNIVTVYVDGAPSSTTLTTLATLPVGYRPPIYIRSRGQMGAYGNDNVQVHIATNGEVKIESSSTTTLAYALVSFVV